jgi:hypothetical protein
MAALPNLLTYIKVETSKMRLTAHTKLTAVFTGMATVKINSSTQLHTYSVTLRQTRRNKCCNVSYIIPLKLSGNYMNHTV